MVAYSLQDSCIYGFALQEQTIAFGTREEFAKTARKRVRDVKARTADAASVYPHLAEAVAGHVARHGYSADEAFVFGLDVMLDGPERHLSASR